MQSKSIPAVPPLTSDMTTVSDAEGDVRWRAWQADGLADDRRRETLMRRVAIFMAVVVTLWFAVAVGGLG